MAGGVIRAAEYTIATGYATSIFTNDPVTLVAAGVIQQAAAGGVIFGSFQGCSYKLSTGEIVWSRYWPASTSATEIKAMVLIDPNIAYVICDDGDSDYLTAADIGTCADIVVGTGSTVTGLSAVALDTSTASASTSQLKIIEKLAREGNNYGAANGDKVEMVVMINESFFKQEAGI
jgi:hypothetical protein